MKGIDMKKSQVDHTLPIVKNTMFNFEFVIQDESEPNQYLNSNLEWEYI